MKKLLATCLLALPLAALPTKAWAGNCCVGPFNVDAGFNYHLNVIYNGHQLGGSSCYWDCNTAGPWYLYWPYDAHFQVQAPMPFPYWPTAQSAPTAAVHAVKASTKVNSAYQTVGYYYYPRTTPNYWYGR
jgi:hypothetical protein